MFILSNFSNKNKPLTIKKQDSKNVLSLTSGKLTQFSEIQEIPLDFYCISDGSIEKIEYHSFNKSFDLKNDEKLMDEATEFDAEICFGTKRTKKIIKKVIEDGKQYINKDLALEGLKLDQPLLPKLNLNASTPQESFKIEKMFSIKFLRSLNQKNLKKSNLRFERTTENKMESKIVDYFYVILNSKKSNDLIDDIPVQYSLFEKGDSLKVKKKRILIYFFVVYFIVRKYCVVVVELPCFNFNNEFIKNVLKMIGCRKTGSNYLMDKWPEKDVEIKNVKKRK